MKQTVTLAGILLAFALSLASCGGKSKSEVNIPTEYCEELVKLAEEGNAEAQNTLGCCYDVGQGVEESDAEAFKWFEKSAKQGNAVGQNNLGLCYELGIGVEQSYKEAVKWYKKAAEQGEPQAQWNVGVDFYNKGDYAEAVKWFEKSAAQGYSGGQLMLGVCYFIGRGVDQDKTIGYDLVRKAAEQGNESAIQELEILKANM